MEKSPKQLTKWQIVILSVLTVAVVLLIVILFQSAVKQSEVQPAIAETKATTVPTETTMPETTVSEATEAVVEETAATVPEETELVMLENMAERYAKNPDIVGWICIDDTKLNYPVMHTPEDPEKYLYLSFDETYDINGVPFIDAKCSLDPESDNLLIYGHNMNNGTQFRTLMSYTDESFWEDHPVIHYSTLYETRTYEILACFRDRVYYKYEDVFKFYQFIDAEDETQFNEAITYFKEKSLYDTGVTAEYGDKLITLVTCAYHTENGRFVVVAKLVDENTD